MNDQKFKEHVQETFNSEVPDVLGKIKASPEFRVPEKEKGFSLRTVFNKRFTLSFTSAFIVLLIAVIMLNRDNTVVASTITLDVNPSIEITLDEDDFVIDVVAINDDGDDVVQKNINYKGLTLDKAIEILVERLNELGYIVTSTDANNIVLVEVSSDDEDIKTRLETAFQTKLQTELNKYSQSSWVMKTSEIKLSEQQIAQIRQSQYVNQMTRAKLMLIYRIRELDDTYLIRDLVEMNISELYDIFIQIEDHSNLPDYDKMPPPRHVIPKSNKPYDNMQTYIIS